jgi:putative ABC transport system substrate-binding protein
MARNSTAVGLGAAVLLFPSLVAGEPQQAARVYRIGFVTALSASPEPSTLRAFRDGLHELGYVEGKNVIIEMRFAEGRQGRLPELVAELIGLNLDVLLAGSDLGALAAKKATTSVPIVFAGVSDPVDKGIVTSLARPEGNITGVTVGIGGSGLGGKWVELLKEAVPNISHAAVLENSASPIGAPYVREIEAAARALNMKLDLLDAGNAKDLDRAFAAIGASGAQGIIVANDPYFVATRARLVQFAASKRLPAIYFFKLFADAGGLMAYGPSLEDSYRRAAGYVDKILKGAKPGELPIEQPSRFELVINRRAARALGLTIPQPLLLRADEVIE